MKLLFPCRRFLESCTDLPPWGDINLNTGSFRDQVIEELCLLREGRVGKRQELLLDTGWGTVDVDNEVNIL